MEARGVANGQPQVPLRNPTTPQQPPAPQRKATGAPPPPAAAAVAATGPVSKDPKSKLKEYCEKNKLPQPVYEALECGDARHRVRVTISGKCFDGELRTSKKEAEKSAAQKALAQLNLQ